MFEPLPGMIRLARERQNLTHQQLANLSGVSRSRIMQVEKGDSNLTLKVLLQVANALGLRHIYIAELNTAPSDVDPAMLECATKAFVVARALMVTTAAEREELARAGAVVEEMLKKVFSGEGPSDDGRVRS